MRNFSFALLALAALAGCPKSTAPTDAGAAGAQKGVVEVIVAPWRPVSAAPATLGAPEPAVWLSGGASARDAGAVVGSGAVGSARPVAGSAATAGPDSPGV